jgi:hypothetical protein
LRQGSERVHADVHSSMKTCPAGAVVRSGELLTVGKPYCVHQDVYSPKLGGSLAGLSSDILII